MRPILSKNDVWVNDIQYNHPCMRLINSEINNKPDNFYFCFVTFWA